MPRIPNRQRRVVENRRLARFVEAFGLQRDKCRNCFLQSRLCIVAEQSDHCSHCLFNNVRCLVSERRGSSFFHDLEISRARETSLRVKLLELLTRFVQISTTLRSELLNQNRLIMYEDDQQTR